MSIFFRYKWLAILSFLLCVTVWYFSFGISSLGLPDRTASRANSAAVTWDGGAVDDDWCSDDNWSGNAEPTASDAVTIDTEVTVTTSGCLTEGNNLNFNSLTLGGTNTTTLVLANLIGSGTDITISNKGTLEQSTTTQQTIGGTFTIENGGTLTHTDNGTTHAYEIDFSVATLDVQAGGSITVSGKGFDGGSGTGEGADGDAVQSGGGGAHAGNGGTATADGIVGGTAYCDITDPATIGSGGGYSWSTNGSPGNGGGLIRIAVSATATLNGSVTANGNNGGTINADSAGGGAGGGIKITADTIAGTPTALQARGGDGGNNSNDGGGGGGGCMYLEYTTANSIDFKETSVYGGSGRDDAQHGGAGAVYIKQTGTDGDLYSLNNATAGADTLQAASAVTVDSLTVASSSFYVVTSTDALTVNNASPFSSGDGTGTLTIGNQATFTPPTTFTIAGLSLKYHRTATFTASSSVDMTIGSNGTLDLYGFTTSTGAFTLSSLTINSGGTATHGANSSTEYNMFRLNAGSLTLASGGSIDVDGKGYYASEGPGAGTDGGDNQSGGGGGHAGAGGASSSAKAGGGTYCATSTPATTGSGGGHAWTTFVGGAGGGFVELDVTNTVTLNGTITADGAAGGVHNTEGGGGGAGGGVNISAGTVTGTPQSLTATGGAGGNSSNDGGGGGGGCIYFSAPVFSQTGWTTSTAGGSGNDNGTAGSAGSFEITVVNSAPSAPTSLLVNSTSTSPVALSTTTLVFSSIYQDNDSADVATKARIQVTTSSAFSTITHWESGAAGTSIASTTVGERGPDITYNNFGDAATLSLSLNDDSDENSQTNYYWRMLYFDNNNATGTFSASSTFTLLDAPNEPSGFATTSVSATSVGLSWADNSAVEDNYIVASSTDSATFTTASTTDANVTSTLITGLAPGTGYTFRILGSNTAGTSTAVTTTQVYTLPNPPSAGVATVDSSSQITLSWSGNGNGSETEYYVVDTSDSSRNSGWITATIKVFSDLSANTNYSFTVKARNADGVESDTITISATTDATANPGGGNPGATTPRPEKTKEERQGDGSFLTDKQNFAGEIISRGFTRSRELFLRFKSTAGVLAWITEVAPGQALDLSKSQLLAVPKEKPFTLSAADGEKCVAAVFRDETGELWEERSCFTVDTKPPQASFTVEDNIVDGIALDYPRLSGNAGEAVAGIEVVIQQTRETISAAPPHRGAFARFFGRLAAAGNDDTVTYHTTTKADGSWSYTFSDVLPAGLYRFSVQLVDLAGNISEPVVQEHQFVKAEKPKPLPPPLPAPEPVPPAAPETPAPQPPAQPQPTASSGEGRQPTRLAEVIARETTSSVLAPGVRDVVTGSVDFLTGASTFTLAGSFLRVMETIGGVLDHPRVEEINETVAVPTVSAVAVVNVASGIPLPNILAFLRYFFGQPLLLLRRRKRKRWGIVYDAYTKLPIDLATIRVVEEGTNRVVRSQVTDVAGRFFLVMRPGTYRLEVTKPGFTGVSTAFKHQDEDTIYTRLYHGGSVHITEKDFQLTYSIPLEPAEKAADAQAILHERFVRSMHYVLMSVGLIASVISFTISPALLTGLLIVMHVCFFVIFRRFAHKKLSSYGQVSAAGAAALSRVIVRVFDAAYNKLVDTAVTDHQGRYGVLVGPSVYYATYEKAGYQPKKSPTIDFSSQVTGGVGGVIARDEVLYPAAAQKK